MALVTGASRGIGKAIAVHLARAGFDVAIGARTLHEGEDREHSSTVAASDTRPLPGSLDSTAALVEEAGAGALPVCLDLLDRASLGRGGRPPSSSAGAGSTCWSTTAATWDPATWTGFLDTPVELLDRHLEANVMAPVILSRLVLPGMVERGDGVIINLASSSGRMDPPAPAGDGGWGLGYGMSKGALHRLAGIVAVELGDRGVLAFNLSPGFVATERIAMDMAGFGFDASAGAPADVVGAVAAWLVTAPEARERNGTVGRGPGGLPRARAAAGVALTTDWRDHRYCDRRDGRVDVHPRAPARRRRPLCTPSAASTTSPWPRSCARPRQRNVSAVHYHFGSRDDDPRGRCWPGTCRPSPSAGIELLERGPGRSATVTCGRRPRPSCARSPSSPSAAGGSGPTSRSARS